MTERFVTTIYNNEKEFDVYATKEGTISFKQNDISLFTVSIGNLEDIIFEGIEYYEEDGDKVFN